MEQKWVDGQGRPVRVETAGDGPVVLLIGAAMPMPWTRPLARAVTERGLRVVNFDYEPPPGWGGTGEPRTAIAMMYDAIVVLDELGIESAHVVGISKGAMTAYVCGARFGGRTASVTLVCPVSGHADTLTRPSPGPPPRPGEDALMTLLRTGFSDAFVDEHLDEAMAMAGTMEAPTGSVVRVARAEEDPFRDDDDLAVPTHIIEFGGDRMVLAEHPARYLDAVAHARHTRVRGASHGWFYEHPVEVAEPLAAFVHECG